MLLKVCRRLSIINIGNWGIFKHSNQYFMSSFKPWSDYSLCIGPVTEAASGRLRSGAIWHLFPNEHCPANFSVCCTGYSCMLLVMILSAVLCILSTKSRVTNKFKVLDHCMGYPLSMCCIQLEMRGMHLVAMKVLKTKYCFQHLELEEFEYVIISS